MVNGIWGVNAGEMMLQNFFYYMMYNDGLSSVPDIPRGYYPEGGLNVWSPKKFPPKTEKSLTQATLGAVSEINEAIGRNYCRKLVGVDF